MRMYQLVGLHLEYSWFASITVIYIYADFSSLLTSIALLYSHTYHRHNVLCSSLLQAIPYFPHMLWVAPLHLVVITCLVYNEIGSSGLIAPAFILLQTPVQIIVAKIFSNLRWMITAVRHIYKTWYLFTFQGATMGLSFFCCSPIYLSKGN